LVTSNFDFSRVFISLIINPYKMKHIFYSLAFLVTSSFSFSQTFWSEDFGTGCTQGNVANAIATPSNGAWISNTLTATPGNGVAANQWFISATEAGFAAGTCGDGCLNTLTLTNRSLHIGMNFSPIIDLGAAYLAGPFGYNTNKRAESPVINCTGQNNITLSFLYIAGGVAGQDYFEVQYSANGGTSWTSIGTPTITNNVSCGGQGLWTTYSVTLPVSANNNSNVKIGFRWQNMASAGTDPSAAVDNIELSSSSATPTFAPTFTVATPLCSGNSTTVSIANTGTFAVSGYTWTVLPAGPTVASPNSSATSITFNSGNTYSVTLAATSGTTTAIVTNTLLVNATPTLSVNGPFTICSGQAATLTASGASNYTWNPGGLPFPTTIVFPSTTTSYTVTGTNGNCSSSLSTTVTVNTTPTVNASANPGVICMGSGTTSTLSATGATSYTWNPGNLTGSVVVVSPTSFTNYTVTGSNGSCSASTFVPVFVSNSPTVTANSSSAGMCIGSSMTLTASGGFSYTWSPGGATGGTVVLTPTMPAVYVYTVTATNGTCTAQAITGFTAVLCVGFENYQIDNSYLVYPNPAHDKLFIETNQSTALNIEVIDALGKMILKENHSGETKISVNINHLPKGIYFLKISSGGVFKVVRLVKE
jgi:hypothetical protein